MLVALALFSTGVGREGPNESLRGNPLLRLDDEAEVVLGLKDGVGGLLVAIP